MFILYLLAAIVVTIIASMIFLSHLKMFKLTSHADGVVISASEREIRDDTERREETVVVCGYSAKGKPYELQKVFRGRRASRFAVGMAVLVRYNPAQPQMSDITVKSE